MSAGDDAREAYTAIAWGVLLSHEIGSTQGRRPSVVSNATRVMPLREALLALPGSENTSFADEGIVARIERPQHQLERGCIDPVSVLQDQDGSRLRLSMVTCGADEGGHRSEGHACSYCTFKNWE
jgi:hypothetical protein